MIKCICFIFATILLAGTADAQVRDDSEFPRWYGRIGPARAIFDESAKVSIGGQPVPGASAKLTNNWGVAAEGGYRFNSNVSLSLTIGIPPTTTLSGAGTLAAAGRLARISYGPAVVALEYHLNALGPVKPYIGAGINYTLIVRTRNVLLQNTHIDDTFGLAIVGGVEVPITRRIGLFVDYKKIWASTNASFNLPTPVGPLPGTAKVKLDPSLLHVGLMYSF